LGAPASRSLAGWALRNSPAILLAAAVTLLRATIDRRLIFWLAVAGFAFAVSLGLLPDPFHMLLGALGLPYRPLAERDYFSGPLLLALLAGLCHAWGGELSRPSRPLLWKGIGAGLLLVVLAGNPAAWRALPQHNLSVPEFFREIAVEPEDYLLLEYPFGLVSQTDERTLGKAAYLARYAVWHEKRPVSGLAPYFEPLVFDQVQASSYLFPKAVSPDDLEAAGQALGVAVREWRIGYLVVHPDLLGPDDLEPLRDLAGRSEALCPPVERDGLIIYRALWHPAGCEAP
jgi:hypothetical protein